MQSCCRGGSLPSGRTRRESPFDPPSLQDITFLLPAHTKVSQLIFLIQTNEGTVTWIAVRLCGMSRILVETFNPVCESVGLH
jgi:hypothetical protein